MGYLPQVLRRHLRAARDTKAIVPKSKHDLRTHRRRPVAHALLRHRRGLERQPHPARRLRDQPLHAHLVAQRPRRRRQPQAVGQRHARVHAAAPRRNLEAHPHAPDPPPGLVQRTHHHRLRQGTSRQRPLIFAGMLREQRHRLVRIPRRRRDLHAGAAIHGHRPQRLTPRRSPQRPLGHRHARAVARHLRRLDPATARPRLETHPRPRYRRAPGVQQPNPHRLQRRLPRGCSLPLPEGLQNVRDLAHLDHRAVHRRQTPRHHPRHAVAQRRHRAAAVQPQHAPVRDAPLQPALARSPNREREPLPQVGQRQRVRLDLQRRLRLRHLAALAGTKRRQQHHGGRHHRLQALRNVADSVHGKTGKGSNLAARRAPRQETCHDRQIAVCCTRMKRCLSTAVPGVWVRARLQ